MERPKDPLGRPIYRGSESPAYIDGRCTSKTYVTYRSMLQRCFDPGCSSFVKYGGRGITVSKDWISYENFLRDMGERPDGLTIERIDNNGNYCKENCRWATMRDQSRNKRRVIRYSYAGLSLTIPEWCERIGMKYFTFRQRIKRGWPISRVITEPINDQGQPEAKYGPAL